MRFAFIVSSVFIHIQSRSFMRQHHCKNALTRCWWTYLRQQRHASCCRFWLRLIYTGLFISYLAPENRKNIFRSKYCMSPNFTQGEHLYQYIVALGLLQYFLLIYRCARHEVLSVCSATDARRNGGKKIKIGNEQTRLEAFSWWVKLRSTTFFRF